MAARFDVYENTDGTFFFQLVAANGDVIVVSHPYRSKESAEDGIAAVKAASKDALVVDNGLLSMRHRDAPTTDG